MQILDSVKKKITYYKNYELRFARIYLKQFFFSYVIKFFIALIFLLLVSFFALKIFKPEILTKICLKSQNYFYLYLDFDNKNFSEINISGTQRSDKEKIIKIIRQTQNNRKKSDRNKLLPEIVKNIKKQEKWINNIMIFRSLPNKLNIIIEEYKPFALWHNNKNIYVIDKLGNKVKIDNEEEFDHLIVLGGEDSYLNVETLFNILAISPEISSKVYSATWIGKRRWDIRLESGLLIKLPSSNIESAWSKLIKIYNQQGALYQLKSIDLRIENKTYLEYKAK